MAVDLTQIKQSDTIDAYCSESALDLRVISKHPEISSEIADPCTFSDIQAMNLLCLAQLQETTTILRETMKPENLQFLSYILSQSAKKKNLITEKQFHCDYPECTKVSNALIYF